MRKNALAFALLPMLGACQSFGWSGAGAGVTPEQAERGIMDPTALADANDTETFFASLRRRRDGRTNAFGRDLLKITDFIDRHFFNYSADDPYVNYPSSTTMVDHIGRFGVTSVTGRVPVIDDVTRR